MVDLVKRGGRPTGELLGRRADSSNRTYELAVATWTRWCTAVDVPDVPSVGTLIAFVEDAVAGRIPVAPGRHGKGAGVRQLKPRYVRKILAALHAENADYPTAHPAVLESLRGAGRVVGNQRRQAHPLLLEQLREACKAPVYTPHEKRDRALLLVGWCTGRRGAELAAMRVDQLRWDVHGVVWTLGSSKTNQDGGRIEDPRIPMGSHPSTCPARNLRAWLDELPDFEDDEGAKQSGLVFRTVLGHSTVLSTGISRITVDRVVKRAVAAAGDSPAGYSAHSLRAGLVTTALAAGKSRKLVMAQTGHLDENTLNTYDRPHLVTGESAASGLGL